MAKFYQAPKEGSKNVQMLIFDEEPWREIRTEIFGRSELEIESKEDFKALEEKKVRQFILKKLSLRNYSSFELIKLLKSYQVTEVLIQALILEFQNLGYINDEDWIESFIRGAKAKKKGPFAIFHQLVEKGVDPERAKIALNQWDQKSDRALRIKKILESKGKRYDLADFKDRQKIIASLLRKGYSFEDVKIAINLYMKENL